MTWASSNYDIEGRWRTKYEPVVIKSILILILPVLLFFVYGIVSFVKAAVLSSAYKD
jgi:CHASE3 domain sensor protein